MTKNKGGRGYEGKNYTVSYRIDECKGECSVYVSGGCDENNARRRRSHREIGRKCRETADNLAGRRKGCGIRKENNRVGDERSPKTKERESCKICFSGPF